MPLLPPEHQLSARLSELLVAYANHKASGITILNQMVETMMSADDATLTAWLQAADRSGDFQRHFLCGQNDNACVAALAQDVPYPLPLADVSPVAEKLAARGRVIDLATMTVTTPVPDAEAIPGTQPQPQDT